MSKLILASSSPNRRQILERAGIEFDWIVSNADETVEPGTAPDALVLELSMRKLRAVLPRCAADDTIVTADTVVSIDDEILGKPADAEQAERFLRLLSGRTHVVFTGVSILCNGKLKSFCQTTDVKFYPLTDDEMSAYIDSSEWMGKAGGYGIQGPAALFVERIVGDYNNIFGLPVAQMMREIRKLKEE